MANRYQSFSFTTASVASGVVLQASQVLGPHVYNLVKLKIVRNTGSGNINFRIFKKGVWGSTNRLARWENQAVPLLHPVDKTSGSPGIEALEGIPLPVDDEDGTNFDGTGKLHHELENLGTTSTFTISGEYEEVVVLSGAGDPSWRGAVSALTSLSLRGATSGVVTVAAAAVAGTWTLKLPTSGGTADYALTTDGTGISNWVSGQSIAGLKTTSTPQFARLGLGAAADATFPLLVSGNGDTTVEIATADNTGNPFLRFFRNGTLRGAVYTDGNSALNLSAGNALATHLLVSNAGLLTPGTDNSQDFGSSTGPLRWRTGYFGTALAIGTNPASAGSVRLPNNAAIIARNAANSGDVQLISSNASDQVSIGPGTAGVLVGASILPAADNAYDLGTITGPLRFLNGFFSGTLRFGTYTATPGSITGYITITDAAGNSRKLAVTT